MSRNADLENLLEMLRAWLDVHRRSILDGTFSCRECGALVLDDDAHRSVHQFWHAHEARIERKVNGS